MLTASFDSQVVVAAWNYSCRGKNIKVQSFGHLTFVNYVASHIKCLKKAIFWVPQCIYFREKKKKGKKKIKVRINSCLHMIFCWIDETPCLGKQFG